MKKKIIVIFTFIFLFLSLPQNIITATNNKFVPENINGVFDEGNYLNDEVKTFVKDLNNELASTSEEFQIGVIALQSLKDESIEEFSNRVAREWKVGTEKNNGILFVFAVEDRKSRLEVSNNASIYLTDGESNLYLDIIKSDFRKGQYSEGTLKLLQALKDEKLPLEKDETKKTYKRHRRSRKSYDLGTIILALLIFYFIYLIFSFHSKKYSSTKLSEAILYITIDFFLLLFADSEEPRRRRSNSRDSDDDFDGGSSWSGGSGWSGGGFGGGGSSSSW